MNRTLLIGRAGTGKTRRVLDELRRIAGTQDVAGHFARFQVLLPTYSRAEHLKRRLLREPPGLPGVFDRGIGTFEQMAERETGVRLSELASGTVRDALLRRALADVDAPAFHDVVRYKGFRRLALRFVKEVKSSEPDPGPRAVIRAADRLEAMGESLPGRRGRKLQALARVLAAYQRRLGGAGFMDHEDLLRALLDRLRDHPPTDLRLFALDGFTDLTEVQERIVQILAENAERSLVTLLSDRDGGDTGTFAASWGLRKRLQAGSRFECEILEDNLRSSGDLARLERLFAGESVAPAEPDGSVRFLAGADPDDEADRAARTCLRWAAEGIPLSEMLVVLRRLQGDPAERVIEALARHGLPARLAAPLPLTALPTVRHALRILRVVAGCERRGEVLESIRGGDARDVPASQADRLHEVARVEGVRDVEGLLRLASDHRLDACTRWLRRLEDARPVPDARPPDDVAAELLDATRQLLTFSFDRGRADHRAALDAAGVLRLRDLLAEVVAAQRAAGRDRVTPPDLVAVLEERADDIKVAQRDRRVDVVNVVDAEEARQWEARAAVVVGLRMGVFPGTAREDLFVSDHDRAEVSRQAGVRLPGRIDESLRRERLLFYSAVTRAREQLVLLAPVSDDSGDPVLASPFLEKALEILPPEQRVLEGADRAPGDVRAEPGETFHRQDLLRTALGALTERFGPSDPSRAWAETGLAVLGNLLRPGAPDREDTARVVARAAHWFASPVPALREQGAALARMAAPRPRSASSLRNFAQCAYRHFAEKGLGLREAERAADAGLTPLIAGSIVHKALEVALSNGVTNAAQVGEVFDRVWSRMAGRFETGLQLARDRERMRRAVVQVVTRQATRPFVADHRPKLFEVPFGFDDTPPLVIERPGGDPVELRGMIDRIDVDEQGRAVVLDYKWSKFERVSQAWKSTEEGNDLQLPVYVLAAARVLGLDPQAAGLLALREERMRGRWLQLTDVDLPGDKRDCTRWESERLAQAEERVVELDTEIRKGGIEPLPADPERCGPGQCSFADVCRFEGYER